MSSTQEIVELILKKLIEKFMTNPSNDCVYVTELSKCLYYIYYLYYKAKTDEKINDYIIEGTLMHFIVEKIVNKMISESLINPEDVRCEVDVEKVFNGNVIKGRVDLIINDTIVEFKFTHNHRLIYYSPRLWHFAQVNLYMWMTGLRKGLIIYIHLPTLKVRYWKVNYDEELVMNRLRKIPELFMVKYGKEPDKENFGCEDCPIYAQCRFARIDMFS